MSLARRKLDPFYVYLAREMMQHHAAHEKMAYEAYAGFYRLARARGRELAALVKRIELEERGHYRILRDACPREWGNFEAGVRKRLAYRKPPPPLRTELDFKVASWLFDFAGFVQIGALTQSSFVPYRKAARVILKEELEHAEGGYRRLGEYLAANPRLRPKAKRLVERWTRFSLSAFGTDDTPLDELSLRYGLKRTRVSTLRRNFLRAVKTKSERLFG